MTRTTILLLIVAAFVTLPAAADSATANMNVSVQVIARAQVTVTSQPTHVVVSAADVARGYVDLDAPVVVVAKTNSRRGYLLTVGNTSPGFTSVELSFGDTKLNVVGESWINRPYVPGGEVVSMGVRVRLASGSQPGSYDLPIAFSAVAL